VLRYSPQYYAFIANSTNVVFNNFDISGYSSSSNEAKNTDGWDTYRSSDITIMNSVINNGDGTYLSDHVRASSARGTGQPYATRPASNKRNLADTLNRLRLLQAQLNQHPCGVALVQRFPRDQRRLAGPIPGRV
jgi:hypothetical protein